ncbi:MAG: Do family serine endopeptidase [Firmicutes bacterium]|nr:Do family serine endopeptidase [Bacillota bacterium]MCM1400428.1 Do family serine endopeptidase [Bacteroides sp.]MCM1476932.1 Do family serine endopeptidase [Bacteroides sp.]
MKINRQILAFAAGALIAGTITASNACQSNESSEGGFLTVAQHPGVNTDFTKVAESTINGVVSIKSFATPRQQRGYSNGGDFFNDPFFEFFFGDPYGGSNRRQQPRQQQQPRNEEDSQRQLGLGSGVIISPDGYIVTNNHVIDGAERLEVTLNDNRQFNATVVGADPNTDLALIKIDAKELPVIPMGDSDALKVGEWVLAVGNPFGLTSTVTTGIVSAKARSISSATNGRPMGLESYIQTDAAVNPGNSGGALVNLNGELVGINTAIYSQTGSYAGYSFAIPTAIVTKVATDLKQYGTVQRAFLGITYSPLDAKTAKEKGLDGIVDGLYVESVNDRSAAMEAGLKKGDVITAINGNPTHNSAQLLEQMARMRPGDKVSITYTRDGKSKTVNTTLYNSQGSTKITQASSVTDLGCAFKKLDEETCAQLKINSGLQVVGLKDGIFKNAGIKEGFIIQDINGAKVKSDEDVEKIYNSIIKSTDDHVMFITGIYPTGAKKYYAVPLD